MPDRGRVSRCFLSVALFMFLLASAASVTPVADLDGTAHQSTTAVSDTERGGMLAAGTPHGPIAIDGDADFSDTALLEGWPGDGSPENPYIIEDYNIDVNSADVSCIEIRNITSTYFIIRYCTVTGATFGELGMPSQAGIYLYNVNFGDENYTTRICDNTCNRNYYGIRLLDCYAILVADNSCFDNVFEGIAVNGESSSRNLVTGNLCVGNVNGIGIGADTFENMVLNNRVYNNQAAGIHFWLGFDTVVQENDCQGNIEYGICIRGESTGNQILDNLCVANNVGIFLYTADYNVITNNTCFNNTDCGIHLYHSDNNTVVDNTCNDNWLGIILEDSDSNTMVKNICNNNDHDGTFLSVSSHNTVSDNTCSNNRWGINIVESDSNTVENNNCSSNLYVGIRTSDAGWNEIRDNACSSNSIGIEVEYMSTLNTVSDNTCDSNEDYGIYLSDSYYNTVANSTCNGNEIGISLSFLRNNTVVNSFCSNNRVGISLDGSDANTVTDNTCNYNRIGISLSFSRDNTVVNSFCSNNRIGISLDESDSNTVSDNTCFRNLEDGIFLGHSDSNTVDNNTCNSNDIGISLSFSRNNTVVNSICNYNRIGISLDGSDANTVTDNTCNYNRIGIYLSGSNANILWNNICLGNIEHDTLEVFVDPVILLVGGVVGIIMLGAGWRLVKLLRAGISETWIDGHASTWLLGL